MRRVFAIGLVICAAASLCAQVQQSPEEIRVGVEKMVAMQRLFEQSPDPNVHAELKQLSRTIDPGKSVVTYEMRVSGLPAGEKYDLVSYDIGADPNPIMKGVVLNANGLLTCPANSQGCTSDRKDEVINFRILGAKGQPRRFALLSGNKVRATAYVIPFPIEGKDKGCAVSAVLLAPNAEVVYVTGKGFRPNSTLKMDGVSYGEHQGGDVRTDAQGNYGGVLLPYVFTKSEGTTDVKFTSPECSPSISFRWGTYQQE